MMTACPGRPRLPGRADVLAMTLPRRLSVALAAAGCVALLAGCSGQAAPSGPQSPSNTTSAQPSTPPTEGLKTLAPSMKQPTAVDPWKTTKVALSAEKNVVLLAGDIAGMTGVSSDDQLVLFAPAPDAKNAAAAIYAFPGKEGTAKITLKSPSHPKGNVITVTVTK